MKKIILTCAILFAAISSSFAYNNAAGLPMVYGPGSNSTVVVINATTTIHLICGMTGDNGSIGEGIFQGPNVYWDVPLFGNDTEYQDFTGSFSSLTISFQCSADSYGTALVEW
ncbi:hypothetical protein [Microbacter margulisiae]|uniref:Ig-like domain-containing protein n=1 Tax=Microbacter margulisiae TaxID=1350067 RepID=A0A7W5DTT9_9PORP|nr:hypothetical protein [Microbacter margulisiae]MBB3188113.1 hypothetical protein [Microbacter margulisiae]